MGRIREVAQLVSVRVWGARGRQFESGLPDQKGPFVIMMNGPLITLVMQRSDIIKGIRVGIPIALGYFAVAAICCAIVYLMDNLIVGS